MQTVNRDLNPAVCFGAISAGGSRDATELSFATDAA
jgi:hypothetical protein